MNLSSFLTDKQLKAKEKSVQLASALLNGHADPEELITIAKTSKDSLKAICIEAIEFVTRQQASKTNEKVFDFAISCLGSKAGRVKWEAAKVIANLAHLYPHKAAEALPGLYANTLHDGTVVRWSAAKALSAILVLKTPLNKTLLPEINKLMLSENKRSIIKIYMEALRELEKKK